MSAFNLVDLVSFALKRQADLRHICDAARPSQLKRPFQGGHLLIHANKAYPGFQTGASGEATGYD
jgi:hypothetical protein